MLARRRRRPAAGPAARVGRPARRATAAARCGCRCPAAGAGRAAPAAPDRDERGGRRRLAQLRPAWPSGRGGHSAIRDAGLALERGPRTNVTGVAGRGSRPIRAAGARSPTRADRATGPYHRRPAGPRSTTQSARRSARSRPRRVVQHRRHREPVVVHAGDHPVVCQRDRRRRARAATPRAPASRVGAPRSLRATIMRRASRSHRHPRPASSSATDGRRVEAELVVHEHRPRRGGPPGQHVPDVDDPVARPPTPGGPGAAPVASTTTSRRSRRTLRVDVGRCAPAPQLAAGQQVADDGRRTRPGPAPWRPERPARPSPGRARAAAPGGRAGGGDRGLQPAGPAADHQHPPRACRARAAARPPPARPAGSPRSRAGG